MNIIMSLVGLLAEVIIALVIFNFTRKKPLALAALAVGLVVSILALAPVRAWASQEGTYYWTYLYLKFVTTANRRTCNSSNEGGVFYDNTVHSITFCDGTNWHKLVTGSGANDSWTSY